MLAIGTVHSAAWRQLGQSEEVSTGMCDNMAYWIFAKNFTYHMLGTKTLKLSAIDRYRQSRGPRDGTRRSRFTTTLRLHAAMQASPRQLPRISGGTSLLIRRPGALAHLEKIFVPLHIASTH